MTIQTRTVYALFHARTGKWYRNAANKIRIWQYSRDASKYRATSFLTTDWEVKPIVEKLERGE